MGKKKRSDAQKAASLALSAAGAGARRGAVPEPSAVKTPGRDDLRSARAPSTPKTKSPRTATSSSPSGEGNCRCVHAVCGSTGFRMVSVPTSGPLAAAVMKRLLRDDEYIAASAGLPRFMCEHHLVDTAAAVRPDNIKPYLTSDPIYLGFMGKRSEAGEKRYRETHGPPRTTRTATGQPPADEPAYVKRMREEMAAMAIELGQLRADRGAAPPPKPKLFSYEWLMADEGRCKCLASLNRTQLCAFVELLEAANGQRAHEELAGRSRGIRQFRDAVTMAIVRLYRCRPYEMLAHIVEQYSKNGKVEKEKMRTDILSAIQVTVYIGLLTTLRPLDRAYAELHRTNALKGEFGHGGGQGPIVRMTDGIKVRVNAPGQSKAHRQVHSAYCAGPMAQAQVVVDQTFRVARPTYMAGGSYSESTHIKNDLGRITAGCEPGDCIGTDKGMDLDDMLGDLEMRHVRPTLMAKTESGTGMDRSEGDASRRFSAVRASTEWVVRLFKQWDIFNGKPVAWLEWRSLDMFVDFVTMVIQIRGPLPDRRRDPSGEWGEGFNCHSCLKVPFSGPTGVVAEGSRMLALCPTHRYKVNGEFGE